jgi:hypothetical protein
MQEPITTADQQILRTGGLAGIIGSIVFICLFPIVALFVGDDPTTLIGWVERFESIRYGRVLENGGYILALTLWMAYFMALHRAARPGHAGFALFGSGLCIVGLGVMAAGALTHIAVTPLYDIYYAEATTSTDQAALVLMWQATWGIFDALLIAGFAPISVGLTMLGIAMLRSPYFGRWFSGVTLVIGVVSVIAVMVLLVFPQSLIAIVIVFGLIFLNLATGWRLTRLAKRT